MKFCTKCGTQCEDNANVCQNCGTAFVTAPVAAVDPSDHTAEFDPKDISDYRFLIGGISYVILLFLFLIVFIAKKIIK